MSVEDDGSEQTGAAEHPVGSRAFFGPWNDRFELGSLMAKGSQGEVFTCTRRRTGIKYAVKKIDTGSLEHRRRAAKLRGDLRHEIQIMRELTHPRIVNLLEAFWEGSEGEVCLIVMDLVQGGCLQDKVKPGEGLGTEGTSKHVAAQLLEGLGYMHANSVIHRDLKPANVLVLASRMAEISSEEGQAEVHDIKIADFGLSRCLRDRTDKDEENMKIAGTPAFAAPEVGAGNYDERADFWSLGCILYVTLCGEYPFSAEVNRLLAKGEKPEPHPCEAWNRVSEAGRSFVLGLLAVHPRERLNLRGCLGHRWMMVSPGAVAQQLFGFAEPSASPRASRGPRRAVGGRLVLKPKRDPLSQRLLRCWWNLLASPFQSMSWSQVWSGTMRPAVASDGASQQGVIKVIGGWTGVAVDSLELRFRDKDRGKLAYGGDGGTRQSQWYLSADELVLAVVQGMSASDGFLGNAIVFFTSLCRIITIQGSAASAKARFVAPSGTEVVGLQFDGSRLAGIHMGSISKHSAVKRIKGWEGYAVDSVSFELRDGTWRSYGRKGGNIEREWLLEDTEHILIVEQGRRDGYLGYSFTFYTNKGRVLQLRGLEASRSLRCMAPEGQQVCGLQFDAAGTLASVSTCPRDGDMDIMQTHLVHSGMSGSVVPSSEGGTTQAST